MKAARFSVELDGDPTADGKQGVRLVIAKYGRARWQVGIKVPAKDWDRKKQRVKFGARDHGLINDRIERAISKAKAIEHEHPHLDAKGIKAKLGERAQPPMSFAALMALDLQETPPGSEETAQQRRILIAKFARWDDTTPVQQVDSLLMERWYHHLRKKISHNGAVSQINLIRTMYRRCCRRLKIAPMDILHGFDSAAAPTEPSQLTAEEVDTLIAWADGQEGWLAKSAHVWIFGYLSWGIRRGDLLRLKTKNLAGDRVTLWKQGKTDAYKSVPLHPTAKRIAELYTQGDYVFGINGDQEPTRAQVKYFGEVINRHLKKAAKACGIAKRLHIHNNRHSFGGELLKKGVDDRIGAKGMGISERMFRQHYRGSVDQKAVDEAAAVVFKREG